MVHKRILIIIPDLGLGGTNSSLNSIYCALKKEVNFSVFSISKYDKNSEKYDFCESLLPYNYFLHIFDGLFTKMSFIDKFISLLIKPIKRFLIKFYPQYIDVIYKRIIEYIGINKDYDTIISFQEGFTTHFTSLIPHNNKIAWIHCNYCEVVPEYKSEIELYKQFKKIVCVSNYTSQCFKDRYPQLANNVFTIYNLFDESRLNSCYGNKKPNANILNLISVGRIDRVKRFSTIPHIVDSLCERNLNIKWKIIGGVSNDLEEGNKLRDALNTMNFKNNVEWLGPKDNPCVDMLESDLYVCLSESEACPMVFIEAKMLRLPILTTDFGSAKEFVADGENGIISSFEEIVDKIDYIYNHRNELETYRNNLKKYKYDNMKIVESIKQLL